MNTSLNTSSLKQYALPLIAVVVVGICGPLVVWPQYQAIQADLATLSTTNQTKDLVLAKVTTLSATNSDTNKQLLQDYVEPAYPSEADPAGLLGALEKIAQNNGASIKTVSYASASAAVPATETATEVSPDTIVPEQVKVTISVGNTYGQIMAFVAKAEQSARLTSFTTLHITTDDSTGGQLATIEVVAPYMAFPTYLGAPELALPALDANPESVVMKKLKALETSHYSPTQPEAIPGKSDPFK